jgi:hypothetical protein
MQLCIDHINEHAETTTRIPRKMKITNYASHEAKIRPPKWLRIKVFTNIHAFKEKAKDKEKERCSKSNISETKKKIKKNTTFCLHRIIQRN